MIAIKFQEEAEGSASDQKLRALAERLRSLAKHVPERPYVSTQLLDIAHELEAAEEERQKGDVDEEEDRGHEDLIRSSREVMHFGDES